MKEVKDLFTKQVCSDLGIQLLSLQEDQVVIGAMNSDYYKLNDFVEELRKNFSIHVLIRGISSDEWERWFDNDSVTATGGQIYDLDDAPSLEKFSNENLDIPLSENSNVILSQKVLEDDSADIDSSNSKLCSIIF